MRFVLSRTWNSIGRWQRVAEIWNRKSEVEVWPGGRGARRLPAGNHRPQQGAGDGARPANREQRLREQAPSASLLFSGNFKESSLWKGLHPVVSAKGRGGRVWELWWAKGRGQVGNLCDKGCDHPALPPGSPVLCPFCMQQTRYVARVSYREFIEPGGEENTRREPTGTAFPSCGSRPPWDWHFPQWEMTVRILWVRRMFLKYKVQAESRKAPATPRTPQNRFSL